MPDASDEDAANTLRPSNTTKAGPPPLNQVGKDIEELLIKLHRIESLCLGSGAGEADATDEFVVIKKEIYACLFLTKNMIREKYQIQAEQGNTVEAIQKASLINKNIDMMFQKFNMLKETFKKQTKKVDKGISADELDNRFREMQVIKRQMEECKDLTKKGTEIPEVQMLTLTDFIAQMDKAEVAPPAQFDDGGQGWREPTAEELATINRWAARDKEFDRQIFEVGKVVDRLNVIAQDLGTKAQEQGRMALELSRQADEANEEVVFVNAKLKELLSRGNGLNFCCKLLLTLVLISLIGAIVQNLVNRVKGKFVPSATQSARTFSASPFDEFIHSPAGEKLFGSPGFGKSGSSNLIARSIKPFELGENADNPWAVALAMGGVVQPTQISWSRFQQIFKPIT